MGAKKTDISQIRKYLNGELDARAMHQLERAAQDDPFLMDALEGYQASGLKQSDLDGLDNKLAQRIQGKQRKIIPWMYMAAAASILIVFTLGYLLWPAGQQATTKQTIAATAPPAADHAITPLVDTLLKPPAKENMLAAIKPTGVPRRIKSRVTISAPVANAAQASDTVYKQATVAADKEVIKADTQTYAAAFAKKVKRDTTPALREITIRGFGSVKKSDVTGAASSVQTNALQGKVEGVEVTTPENRINGTIYDNLGRPLSGVSIAVVGKQLNAITDMNGRFSVPAAGKETLSIASIGFESQQVKAKASDSINIALNPQNNSLAEVVVAGYGRVKKEPKEAHPKMGWDNYKKYIHNRAVTNDGTRGNVRLSFTVSPEGELSDFKIINGLNEAINQQAIELVKKGPAWARELSGQPKTVKLKIHFVTKK